MRWVWRVGEAGRNYVCCVRAIARHSLLLCYHKWPLISEKAKVYLYISALCTYVPVQERALTSYVHTYVANSSLLHSPPLPSPPLPSPPLLLSSPSSSCWSWLSTSWNWLTSLVLEEQLGSVKKVRVMACMCACECEDDGVCEGVVVLIERVNVCRIKAEGVDMVSVNEGVWSSVCTYVGT